MDSQQAKKEFEAILSERRACLSWLRELTENGLHPRGKADEHAVSIPPKVYHCLFGQASSKSADKVYSLRRLRVEEIQVLTQNQCRSQDWSRVWLFLPDPNISQEAILSCFKQRVHSTAFSGSFVILGWPSAGVKQSRAHPSTPSTQATPITDNSISNIAEQETASFYEESVAECEDATETERTFESKSKSKNHMMALSNNSEWDLLPQGIFQTTVVADSFLQMDAWVHQNRFISRTFIASYSAVMGCGKVTAASSWNPFDETIKVGPEALGGRYLTVTPQDTMIQVSQQLTAKASSIAARRASRRESARDALSNSSVSGVASTMREYDENNSTFWSLISRGSVIRETVDVSCVYMHMGASIQGASLVHSCVLFPTSEITQGACTVTDCFLQWQSTIQDASTVSRCLLMEACHVGPHSKIGNSILGPDVALSSGEVRASVLGPNTAAHHQSLLIGLLCLHGRNNVGYGAKIGSNHTGRSPDQEAVCGEGIFWGLSTAAIYPVNMLNSPYSVVSDGTVLSPGQTIEMPFSLFSPSDRNGSTEIVPAWVLTHSPYSLVRCIQNIQSGRKSRAAHHAHYTSWPVMDRRDVLLQVYKARNVLKELPSRTTQAAALGRSTISEKNRKRAIKAYTDALHRSSLLELLRCMEADPTGSVVVDLLQQTSSQKDIFGIGEAQNNEANGDGIVQPPKWPELPWMAEDLETDALHLQLFVLVKEFDLFLINSQDEKKDHGPVDHDDMEIQNKLDVLLGKNLVQLNNDFLENVKVSKAQDEIDGRATIPDYQAIHTATLDDKVVCALEAEIRDLNGRIRTLLQNRKN